MFSVKGSDKQQYGQGSSPNHNLEKPAGWCSCLHFCHPHCRPLPGEEQRCRFGRDRQCFCPDSSPRLKCGMNCCLQGSSPTTAVFIRANKSLGGVPARTAFK